ncbi:hypothetical protein Q1695_012005 [Nippostrongylus brasiliensis]|nr:hypothetical protein Q1695_012005 [Nippostrongylus brasiliensis]
MELEKMDTKQDGPQSNSSDIDDTDRGRPTDWHSVTMAGFVTFLSAVENTVVGMSEWPYMHTIDPDATSQFFGLVSSVSKLGHALFAVAFAYWAYKSQSTKVPLIMGRVIAFASCCIYLCVELLPTGRRFLMLFCYFLFGVAASSSTILRAYIAAVSTTEDRARAYSAIVVANMLSVVFGPICQLAFANVPYPGYVVFEGFLKFHIYSAPIWIAWLTNFISVAIIWFGLREHPHESHHDDEGMFTLEGIRKRIKVIRSLNLLWSIIVLCWVERIVASLSIVTLQSTMSPLVMISFGWDGQTTVKIMAITMSPLVMISYIVLRVGRIIPPRTSFLIAIMIPIAMYLLSYPYDSTSHKMAPYNATTGSGCNPNEYTWCDTASATYPWIFLPIICIVMGIGVPMSQIALDTIYSKVLGNIDQSMMQGMLIVAEDLILILGPLYAASMFSHVGQSTLWLVNALATAGGVVLWLGFFPQLKRYK